MVAGQHAKNQGVSPSFRLCRRQGLEPVKIGATRSEKRTPVPASCMALKQGKAETIQVGTLVRDGLNTTNKAKKQKSPDHDHITIWAFEE